MKLCGRLRVWWTGWSRSFKSVGGAAIQRSQKVVLKLNDVKGYRDGLGCVYRLHFARFLVWNRKRLRKFCRKRLPSAAT
jgi:hypothetical protein